MKNITLASIQYNKITSLMRSVITIIVLQNRNRISLTLCHNVLMNSRNSMAWQLEGTFLCSKARRDDIDRDVIDVNVLHLLS